MSSPVKNFEQMITDIHNIISEARTATNKAIAEHDLESLMTYYSDDIIIIRGDGNMMHNKDAAENTWRKIFTEEPTVSFLRNPHEIIISSNNLLAWEKGTWTGINTYSSGGNYAAMWCYNNNLWKIKAELFVAL